MKRRVLSKTTPFPIYIYIYKKRTRTVSFWTTLFIFLTRFKNGFFNNLVVTHFWVPIKNKINKPKEVRKITGGRSAQKTVRKLVKKFKNTKIEFLTVYSWRMRALLRRKFWILRRKAQIWMFMDLIGFLFEFIEDLIARKIDF